MNDPRWYLYSYCVQTPFKNGSNNVISGFMRAHQSLDWADCDGFLNRQARELGVPRNEVQVTSFTYVGRCSPPSHTEIIHEEEVREEEER